MKSEKVIPLKRACEYAAQRTSYAAQILEESGFQVEDFSHDGLVGIIRIRCVKKISSDNPEGYRLVQVDTREEAK